jgi:molybdopterin converting factor small subunit
MVGEPSPAAALRTILIRLHARSAEIAGRDAVVVRIGSNATVRDVKQALAVQVPELAGILPSSALASERDYLTEKTSIDGATSLHLLPPVSGG